MLELGQDVTIAETPAYGSTYFDEDELGERDYVCGIRLSTSRPRRGLLVGGM